MKKILFAIIMVAAVAACQKQPAATATIDENGDLIFQNNLVCYRLNGARNPVVTDGMEAILKATVDKKETLKDRKVALAASLNDGGTALVVNDSLVFPHENFDSFEIVEQTPTHVIFTVHYPKWVAGEDSVSLTRTVTLRANSYFFEVKDNYDIRSGVDIKVATGFAKRGVEKNETGSDCILLNISLRTAHRTRAEQESMSRFRRKFVTAPITYSAAIAMSSATYFAISALTPPSRTLTSGSIM